MTIAPTDAQLVAGHLTGDPAALAGIYGRYADSLYDTAAAMLDDRNDAADVVQDVFLVAASKLGQLRDPDRLKPWMFAILRNEVFRRTKQRKRTVATDFSNDDMAAASGFDMTDERGLGADTDAVESGELAALVRGAARGLDERDQLVLELSVRQGLDGQDLADALGVSANQSYTLVHRMRERVEKSLGAFCVARAGRKDCDELDGILGNWDGDFTVLIRKRVARHIERCESCAASRRKVAPLALFGGAPAFAAPAALRDRVLGAVQAQSAALATGGPHIPYGFAATGGFPSIMSAGRKVAAWIAPTAAASILLVAAGVGFWFLGGDSTPGTFQTAVETSVPAAVTTLAVDPTTSLANPATSTTASESASTTAATTLPPSTLPVTTPQPTSIPPTTPAPSRPAGPQTTRAPHVAPPTQPPANPPGPTQPPVNPPGPTTPPAPTNPSTSPPTPTGPPTRGEMTGSSTALDLGNNQSASFSLSNPGGSPVTWTASGAQPFSLSPSTGTLAPGSTTPITVGLDRGGLAEGRAAATITFTGDGGQSVALAVNAQVNRQPVIANINGPGISCIVYVTGAGTLTVWQATISASITDESGGSATFSVNGPGGRSGSATQAMSPQWSASVDSGTTDPNQSSANGVWNWTIVATDTLGNAASTSGSTTVQCQ